MNEGRSVMARCFSVLIAIMLAAATSGCSSHLSPYEDPSLSYQSTYELSTAKEREAANKGRVLFYNAPPQHIEQALRSKWPHAKLRYPQMSLTEYYKAGGEHYFVAYVKDERQIRWQAIISPEGKIRRVKREEREEEE
ncbi:MAG: hypothetical protein GXP10_04105 [Gammaproteobacteria bacterium]|nr:hypothetical protein [Gammaproteobacteria bacterium]